MKNGDRRPAKAGDEGRIARFCDDGGRWFFGELREFNAASSSFGFVDDEQINWEYCEVLEAYLSDEEVERLGEKFTDWFLGDEVFRRKHAVDVISEHFEKGGK